MQNQNPITAHPKNSVEQQLHFLASQTRRREDPAPLAFKGLKPLTPEEIKRREEKELRESERARENQIFMVRRSLLAEIGSRYAACSLENYQLQFAEQQEAVSQVSSYLTAIVENVQAGRGLIFYGTVGTGKDHLLAAALFNAVDAGFTVAWRNAQSVFEAARDQMDRGDPESSLIERFTKPQVLGLSDPIPPAGELSGFRIELLWRIVDIRYRWMRPVWMTLNAGSIDDCKTKLSVPLWDRLQDNAVIIPCFWPTKRKH